MQISGAYVLAVVADDHDFQRAAAHAALDQLRIIRCTSAKSAPENARVLFIGKHEHEDSAESVAFVLPSSIDDDKLRLLLRALATDAPISQEFGGLHVPRTVESARAYTSLFAASRQIVSSIDLVSAEWAIVTTIADLIPVDHAYCYFFSNTHNEIWSETAACEFKATRGLIAYVARTGSALDVRVVSDEPLWDARLDAPGASKHSQLLAQPVLCRRGRVQAVLVAARKGGLPFSADERSTLAQLSCVCGPYLEELSAQIAAENVLQTEGRHGLFRVEAARSNDANGAILQLATSRMRFGFYALVLASVVALAALVSIRIPTYVQGQAIVHNESVRPMFATSDGVVASLDVRPGESVDKGTILLRLLAPRGDQDSSFRTMALTSAESSTVVAPEKAVISKVLIKQGDYVKRGDIVAFLRIFVARPEATILVPAATADAIKPGMEVRVDLAGYKSAGFAIQSVWPTSLDLRATRELVGNALADVPAHTTVMTASALSPNLPSAPLGVNSQQYVGQAHVQVGTQSVFHLLISRGKHQ